MVLLQVTPPPTHNNGHRDRGLSLPQFDQAEQTGIPCSSAYLLRDTFQHPRGQLVAQPSRGLDVARHSPPTCRKSSACMRSRDPQPAGRQGEGSSQPRMKDLARQGSTHTSLQIHGLGCPRGGDLSARGRRQKEKLGFYGGGRSKTGFWGPRNEWINPWAMLP